MRPAVLVAIAVVVLGLVLATVPMRAAADATVSFGPVVLEMAVDTNGNGLYDQLQITVDLIVNVSGTYRLAFSVQSTNLGFGYQQIQEYLSVGTHAITFALFGPTIYEYRQNGPYNVTIRADTGVCYPTCTALASMWYQTHAYSYTQFDPPYAYVSGPITDSGRDTNGDGYYDLLVLNVPITVNQTTELSAYANVLPGTVAGPMTGGVPKTYTRGSYVLEFTFDGRMLYYYKASGPYSIEGSLYLEEIGYAGGFAVTTAAYPYTAFQRADADFDGPMTYEPLGTNGSYTALRLHVPLRVSVAGDYLLQSSFGYGYGTGTNAYRAVRLIPGPTTVDLDFNGIALNRLGYDGPWSVNVMVERLGGPVWDANDTLFMTPPYTVSEFESRPVSNLGLNLSVAGCTANCLSLVAAYDPSNGFIQWQQPGATSLPLYDGTFEVLVPGMQSSVVEQVTMSGTRELNVALRPPPTEWVNQTYDFVTVNETIVSTAYTTWGRSAAARWWADLSGNHDGIANTTELTATAWFYTNWLSGANVDLDNVPYPSGDVIPTAVIGAGPVTDTAPVTLQDSQDLRFPELPTPSFPKNITILLPYTPSFYRAFYDFKLSVGMTASLTTTNAGTPTQVGRTEWTLLAAEPTFMGYPRSFSSVVIEVGGTGLASGGPVPVTVLLIVLVLMAVVGAVFVLLVVAVLRGPRPRKGKVPPPTPPASK